MGWHEKTIDGNDHGKIRQALQAGVDETDRPTLIIGKTIMGKGAITDAGGSFEKKVSTHGQPLSKAGASFGKTIEALGGNPEQPFDTFPAVKEYFENLKTTLQARVAERKAGYETLKKVNPALSDKLDL